MIEAAFIAACADEIAALKPGNVHIHAPGHGMDVADFARSAAASAPALCARGAPLGRRILDAVTATRRAVGQNTNLGIILLCAPLAMAAEAAAPDLRTALRRVLDASDRGDAGLAFRAIALASPGGLGSAPEHDVRGPATVTLPQAMAAAAERDRVAFQYASGFADVFETGLPALAAARAPAPWPTVAVYLRFLVSFRDSHIVRKHGREAAEKVRQKAKGVEAAFEAAADPALLHEELLAWDSRLKASGLNPGTTADLTVATLFAHGLGSLPGALEDG